MRWLIPALHERTELNRVYFFSTSGASPSSFKHAFEWKANRKEKLERIMVFSEVFFDYLFSFLMNDISWEWSKARGKKFNTHGENVFSFFTSTFLLLHLHISFVMIDDTAITTFLARFQTHFHFKHFQVVHQFA